HVDQIDTQVVQGRLSVSDFNADLSHAINAAHLGAHDAVLFTPDSGTLSGETFLVVDLNGKAGYQAGQDLVIHLDGATGTLTTGDFIGSGYTGNLARFGGRRRLFEMHFLEESIEHQKRP